VQCHERPRQFEVDVIRDHHRVLELVAVLDELPEAPRSVIELGGRQVVVGVQPSEDGETDLSFVELVSGASWQAPFRPFCVPH
jgi:hypothetical protein